MGMIKHLVCTIFHHHILFKKYDEQDSSLENAHLWKMLEKNQSLDGA